MRTTEEMVNNIGARRITLYGIRFRLARWCPASSQPNSQLTLMAVLLGPKLSYRATGVRDPDSPTERLREYVADAWAKLGRNKCFSKQLQPSKPTLTTCTLLPLDKSARDSYRVRRSRNIRMPGRGWTKMVASLLCCIQR